MNKSKTQGNANNDIPCDDIQDRSIYVYDLVNKWIENADNKVSIACGIFGAVFGVITFLSEKISGQEIKNDCLAPAYKGSFILSLIIMGVSILMYVLSLNPSLVSAKSKGNKKGQHLQFPVFFGDIAALEIEEYIKIARATNKDNYIREIQKETYTNAKICKRKMVLYKTGLWFSVAAILIAVLSLTFRFLMYH